MNNIEMNGKIHANNLTFKIFYFFKLFKEQNLKQKHLQKPKQQNHHDKSNGG